VSRAQRSTLVLRCRPGTLQAPLLRLPLGRSRICGAPRAPRKRRARCTQTSLRSLRKL